MKSMHRPDRILRSTARVVAEMLATRCKGTALRARKPKSAHVTNTGGWHAIVGSLGPKQPRLEIWLDKFSGHSDRKLYACFYSEIRPQVVSLTKQVSKKLWPIREITTADVDGERYLTLLAPLKRNEFNVPILEKYQQGRTFYGIYDLARSDSAGISPHFCSRAVDFFLDVVGALTNAVPEDEQREIYPRIENRKLVASHLQRERSGLLATECKIRDNYKCQVCSLRFEEFYGPLERPFAEAHHKIPLAQLREGIRTKLSDLATVCANCHRMLHRLSGKRTDIDRLRAIVKKRRTNRRKE
jgi:5-methylcytosine-specific restriction endonuclease McrA